MSGRFSVFEIREFVRIKMKIIFLGLFIAVLVVCGHGDDSNELFNMSDIKTLIEVLKGTILSMKDEESKVINEEKEVNETKAKKIEKYRKKIVEGDQKLSVIRNQLTDPNLSTELRSAYQRFVDILTEYYRNSKKRNEKRIKELHEEIRRSRQGLEQLNIMVAQFVNSTRRLIDSYPQYA